MIPRRYLTEFRGDDGVRYAGLIILADCHEAAQAIRQACLLGPSGQPLTLLGELAWQDDTVAERRETVRPS